MKTLSYFERRADELRAQAIDYKMIAREALILALMKEYRKEAWLTWPEYRKLYDQLFNKYHA